MTTPYSMTKIAIFWEKRFRNNKLFDTSVDPNLSPYTALKSIMGNDAISYDLLPNKKNKDDYIILCFLTLWVFSIVDYIRLFVQYPRNKKYFFIFEPKAVAFLNYNTLFHSLFDRVYTWNDDLVDNKKYFKFIYPSSRYWIDTIKNIPFSEKKLLILVSGNKRSLLKDELYSERRKFIRYAESHKVEFDLYGTNWDKPLWLFQKIFWFEPYSSYRGRLWYKLDKLEKLSRYKFTICFENMQNAPWLITEKIFDSFKAKVVPVYRGAPNIADYIPKECFIDFRQFKGDYTAMVQYLKNMSEQEYATYLDNIELFLQTDKAHRWFDHARAQNFMSMLDHA